MMNTREVPIPDDEGVSPPYRPGGPVTRSMPRPLPVTSLPAGWRNHPTVDAAGVKATILWLFACDLVRQRGQDSYIKMTEMRRLLDFEDLRWKAKEVIEDGINAGLFSRTMDGVNVYTDALDQRRGG